MLRGTARTTAVPTDSVQTVLGVHLLKEMFNLTDDEALEQLEFNLLWKQALRQDMKQTHVPQKKLHSFRVRLMQHDGGQSWLSRRPRSGSSRRWVYTPDCSGWTPATS